MLTGVADQLSVDLGLELLKVVPGRVSTEVDANLSYSTQVRVASVGLTITFQRLPDVGWQPPAHCHDARDVGSSRCPSVLQAVPIEHVWLAALTQLADPARSLPAKHEPYTQGNAGKARLVPC